MTRWNDLCCRVAGIVVFSWGFTAHAQTLGCPPEKPFTRIVEGKIVSCTLVMCLGKLICDDKKVLEGSSRQLQQLHS